jgi:hypothetical protein
MASFLHLLLYAAPIMVCLFVVLYVLRKRNFRTGLYNEGLYNENKGNYKLALHKYEDALNENEKRRLNKEFGRKIAQRIKILRTTLEYENNFHASQGGDSDKEARAVMNIQK